MKKVYDAELIKYMALFEKIGNVNIKDIFQYNGMLCCVVDKENVSKLVGPQGIRIKKIQDMIKKKVKVVGYSSGIKEFVKDFIYPIEIIDIEENNGELIISCEDNKTKGLLIGRGRQGLTNLHNVVSRYFKINNIKVK
ncbi:NusA-like transcription termination signal-binding factor [Candidatus Woesearchaeota archaeon]|nr:NusA-like transcription termination signal-binding factor [Candidatus Woesearchaeota archaeon]